MGYRIILNFFTFLAKCIASICKISEAKQFTDFYLKIFLYVNKTGMETDCNSAAIFALLQK